MGWVDGDMLSGLEVDVERVCELGRRAVAGGEEPIRTVFLIEGGKVSGEAFGSYVWVVIFCRGGGRIWNGVGGWTVLLFVQRS